MAAKQPQWKILEKVFKTTLCILIAQSSAYHSFTSATLAIAPRLWSASFSCGQLHNQNVKSTFQFQLFLVHTTLETGNSERHPYIYIYIFIYIYIKFPHLGKKGQSCQKKSKVAKETQFLEQYNSAPWAPTKSSKFAQLKAATSLYCFGANSRPWLANPHLPHRLRETSQASLCVSSAEKIQNAFPKRYGDVIPAGWFKHNIFRILPSGDSQRCR